MTTALFEQILERLDKVSRPDPAGNRMARCPFHEDRVPSLSIHPERGFNCHGCGKKGSLAELAEALNIPVERKSLGETAAMRALTTRGISKKTISAFGIEADLKAQAWRYPVRDQTGRTVSYRFKAFSPQHHRKFWWGSGPRLAVYGLDMLAERFPQTPTVYLVEGEPDTWTAYECGIPAISFTTGAGYVPAGAGLLLQSLGIQHIEILYDNDDAGKRGARKAAAALTPVLSVGVLSLPKDFAVGADLTDLYKSLDFKGDVLSDTLERLEHTDLTKNETEDIGTPVHLARKQLAPLNPWLAKGIMRRGEFAILSGRADTFKSTFALELAVSVASGRPFLGEIPTAARGPVLFVQEEIHPNFFNYRLASSTAGMDDEALAKFFVWNRRGLILDSESASLEALQRAVEALEPVLVIIDNLTCTYPPGFKENDPAAMTRLFEPLKRMRDERDIGVLLIHHDRKPSQFEGSDSPRGSSVLENAPDCRLHLMRDPNDPDRVECSARLRNGGAALPFSAIYEDGRLWRSRR